MATQVTTLYKPSTIHLTEGERAEIQALADQGELPKDALKRHDEAEAQAVFGHDAKKDRRGNYQQQGLGAPGHETGNHFAALKKAERQGLEPPGTYDRMVAEIWKRDPKRAAALNLPRAKKDLIT